MELLNIVNPIFSGIITGTILLTVSLIIAKSQETQRCRSLITFLRLEIINNYRLLSGIEPNCRQSPTLEDRVWEKVSTEIINKLPFVLTNNLIVHYYFVRYSTNTLITCSPEELERQKNRMKFLIKRLQKFSKQKK